MKAFYPFLLLLLLGLACTQPQVTSPENVVTVRLPAEPERLNPILSTSGYASQVERHIFMPLLQFDEKSLELTPMLAKSRPLVEEIEEGKYEGGLALTFEIREEANWDDGTPVTAEDFIFTFKTVLNPEVASPAFRAYLDFLKDIAPDPKNPKKFTVLTDRKYILAEAALGNTEVYPEHLYDPKGIMKNYNIEQLTDKETLKTLTEQDTFLKVFADRFNSPQYSREKGFVNGCAAYQLEEWISGERIVLKRKANWWGDQLAEENPILRSLPDQIIFRPIPDNTTAITLLKNQELDAMGSVQPENYVELTKNELAMAHYNFHTPPYAAYYYIAFNTKSPKLNDKRTRRALAHILDTNQAIESVMFNLAERTTNHVHPSKPYYNKDLVPISHDPETAKSLLNASGWTDSDQNGWLDKIIDGEKTELELNYKYTNGNKVAENLGLLLQSDAKKVGVKIDLKAMEFSALLEDARNRDFEMYYLAWARPPILDDFRQIWHTQSDTYKGSNRTGFGNAASDALIDSIRVELNDEKRNAMYYRFQEMMYDEQPYIFLFAPKERILIHKRWSAEASARRPGFTESYFDLIEQESAGH